MDADFFDLDADGDLDILTANLDSVSGPDADAPYRAYLNDGDGFFTLETATIFAAGVIGNGLDSEAADFNDDGLTDFYLASRIGSDRLLLQRR